VKVTAVVVTHNSAAELPPSLGALAALPLQALMVVDNASTDASADVARAYTPHVVRRDNRGFGAGVNAGVEAAVAAVGPADAYLLVNPDCTLPAPSYGRLVAALDDDPGLAAVAPLMRYPDGRYGIAGGPEPGMLKEWLAALRVDHLVPRRLRRLLPRRLRAYLAVEPGAGVRTVAWVSGYCMLVRASALRSVDGFDPGFFLYFEDVDLCRRLRGLGWRIALVADSVADHTESASTARVGKDRLYRTGRRTYFDKHGTRTQRLLARALAGWGR
jgi:GT2 family glycosyltransferase